MTEQRPEAARKDRGRRMAAFAERRVAHGVHASMDHMKPADLDATFDCMPGDAHRHQLPPCDDAVLTRRQPGDPRIYPAMSPCLTLHIGFKDGDVPESPLPHRSQ